MFYRFIKWILIALISLTITLNSAWVMAQNSPLEQEQQGKELYQTYQYQQAIEIWQQAIQAYQKQNDQISQARVLSNLALAYQQRGEWEKAEQAIATSLNLIDSATISSGKLPILAQILNNQGLIQFAKGQPENARETWEKASKIYQKIPDQIGYLRSQVNQAKALHSLGLHPRACNILFQALEIESTICSTTDLDLEKISDQTQKLLQEKLEILDRKIHPVAFSAWYTLAEELRDTELLEASQTILKEILLRATSSEEKATVFLSLGKIAYHQKKYQEALNWYQKADKEAIQPLTEVLVLLSQLELFKNTQQWSNIPSLVANIYPKIAQLTPSQDTIYAQINFVSNLRLIKQIKPDLDLPSWLELAKISANTVQQAKIIGSPRTEAYALGNLGTIYEQTKQLDIAQKLTEQALLISQSLNTPEITYHWLWQLGRILEKNGNPQKAIPIYTEAVSTLESIKQDLVAVNQDIQFSFALEVEPVYRELVSLLLQSDTNGNIPQENLRQARDIIESLQLAELDNFLQETCLKAQPKPIDKIDQQAAVIYPIILPDRLEIILSLPHQPLKRYVSNVPETQLKSTALKLRQTLVIRSRRDFYEPAKTIYQWLISPLEQDLENSQVKTLVFVLDGALRNIPIATLYDGKQYLIEKYETAITPGLQLLNPQPLKTTSLYTLGAGLTEAREGFSPLFHVNEELKIIQKNVNSKILLNKAFTVPFFKKVLLDNSFPIVHIATHGQFSSNFEKTFLLAWDGKINIRQLDTILKGKSNSQNGVIELLILSACETATGDERAALGLAGMAVRSGARSTIATLWSVNDEASTELMKTFYQSLAVGKKTKSQSLREAKLNLLSNAKYRHPFYWSAYVLLGNWL
jgi:CHAT domain-containing protein